MCVCMCVCVCTHTHMHTYVYIHAHICICICMYMCVHIFIYMYTHFSLTLCNPSNSRVIRLGIMSSLIARVMKTNLERCCLIFPKDLSLGHCKEYLKELFMV